MLGGLSTVGPDTAPRNAREPAKPESHAEAPQISTTITAAATAVVARALFRLLLY
jgi:hypothetical protein